MSLRALSFTGGVLVVGLALSACEWTGGSDGGFNTSKIDFNVNISGQYIGMLSGGKAVEHTSGGAITRLLLQQTGNAVQVTDSNGQQYRGNVGAPFSFGTFTGDTIPAGASVASFQVSWSGTDGTAAREIDFSGVINVITVDDVRGTTSDSSVTSNQTTSNELTRDNSSSDDQTNSSTDGTTRDTDSTVEVDAGTQTVVIFEPTGNGTTNVIVVTVPTPATSTNETTSSTTDRARDIANSVNVTQNSTQSSETTRDSSTTTTASFTITDANSQFRIQGTWIEEGGLVSNVQARSPGAAAVITLPVEGDAGN
jgi:hypothetical protein